MTAAPAATPAHRLAPLPGRRWPRWSTMILSCLGVGLLLRIWVLARNSSLWGDEAMLALNVVHRPFSELLTPLDLNQGAPVGYLVLVKLLTQAFGAAEWVLRLPSFISGVAALVVFKRLADRTLPRAAAGWASVLFAFSPHVVSYASEFKQYELDLLVTVVVLSAGQAAWRSCTSGAFMRLAVVGAGAVWVSHPAAFVLGGVGAALLIHPGDRRKPALRLAVIGAWGLSFLVCFFLFTRRLTGSAYLSEYWAGAFWPVPPREPGDVAWLAHHLIALFEVPGGFSTIGFGSGGLALVCAAVGMAKLWQTDRRLCTALVTPIGLALGASALERYPFAGRLMLFAVPILVLAIGQGLATLFQLVRPLGRIVGPALAAALLAPMLAELTAQMRQSPHAEEVRPVLARIGADWQPGDRLLVTPGAQPAVGYYLPRTPIPPEATGIVPTSLADWPTGPGRTWVLIAHAKPAAAAALTAGLEARGTCREVVAAPGAVGLLFTPRINP